MIGDKGRETSVFSEAEDFETPVFYSGRAIVASDLNEVADRQVTAREKALIDVIGHVGFPRKAPGFRPTRVEGRVRIGTGRMYVDGARFEQRAIRDYSIGELGGTGFDGRMVLVACCAKVERDYLDFPFIRDDGLGGPDTAGRRSGVVDIHLVRMDDILADNGGTETGLRARIENGDLLRIAARDGRAAFRLDAAQPATEDHCRIAPEGGFNRQGNFNYIVQIHKAGITGTATFKWARDDVRALVEQTNSGAGNVWVLREEPTDDQRRFATGSTIEIRGADERELNRPGVLGQITSLDPSTRQIELTPDATQALSDLTAPLTITRWDQPFGAGTEDGIVTASGTTALENNLAVNFTGDHLAGDYWYCAARIRTGDILWPPRNHDAPNGLVPPFNWGPRCVALGLVDVSENTITRVEDLRTRFPDLNHIQARDVTISGIPPCGLTSGMTVQQALARICAMTRDPCCLTVRPDRVDGDLLGMREDLAELPTLGEALRMWWEVLENLRADGSEPYNRRMAIKFTQGEYVWDFKEFPIMQNLHSLSLTTCSGAPVVLDIDGWLTADRCMQVRMDGLTIRCKDSNSGVSVMNGKSVEIKDCFLRRPYKENAPVLKLAAKRDITLRNTRVQLDNVRDIEGFRPAIQIMNARAQTTFESVQSNGSVIAGPVLPVASDDVVSKMVASLDQAGAQSVFPPVRLAGEKVGPHQSAPTLRMTGCKIWKFVPDVLMMREIADWIDGKNAKVRDLTLNVADHLQRVKNPFIRQGHEFVLFNPDGEDRKLDWNRLSKEDFRITLRPKEIPDRDKVPFRVIDITDTEFRRGTSLFVGQTVSLRNCRFTQFGEDHHKPEKLQNLKLPFGHLEFEEMVFDARNERVRPWYPVGMVVSRWSGLQGNMGFPEQGHSRPRLPKNEDLENGLPLLVDFGKRNATLRLPLAIAGSIYEALRMQLITLHAMELKGTLNN